MEKLLAALSFEYGKLRTQVIMPAEGFIKHDYLVPGGFYKQMWDWDGFFIGCHLATRSQADAEYLKWWVLNFVCATDDDGYVSGCMMPEGPRQLFGKFGMKPFLAQGAYFASEFLGDFSWTARVYDELKQVISYRENTQLDSAYGLFFWDNAMQSGADNNPVLSNDDADRSAILACDMNVLQMREYIAMAHVAAAIGQEGEAAGYKAQADRLRQNMLAHLWFQDDGSFFNVRRDTGFPIKRVSYSNFVPLMDKVASEADGRRMIHQYLWNRDHMLSEYGLRSLSKQDDAYNNDNIIIPYSNWRGPVWPIANYFYFIGLMNYGFDDEAAQLADTLGTLCLDDIRLCGSMHENYHAETGEPLAPTAEQSAGGVFSGFVGWNLLVQNMLEGVVEGAWLLLKL